MMSMQYELRQYLVYFSEGALSDEVELYVVLHARLLYRASHYHTPTHRSLSIPCLYVSSTYVIQCLQSVRCAAVAVCTAHTHTRTHTLSVRCLQALDTIMVKLQASSSSSGESVETCPDIGRQQACTKFAKVRQHTHSSIRL